MICDNCGDEVNPERYALGYHYCMRFECIRECMRKPRVAVIGVHKSNPQIVALDSDEVTRNVSYMER